MAISPVFLDIVDDAQWVKVDRRTVRMFVWKGATSVGVYSTEDGSLLDEWECSPSMGSAAVVVAERTNGGY
jgi:hypothetical protein